jgi:GTP cyclohydrolase I
MQDYLIEEGVKMILQGLEVDLDDRNYKDTPNRVLRFYKELFEKPALELPEFDEPHDEMVILRHHKTWGMCPHHLLPVEYTVSVGYLPRGRVIGLSKLARIVDKALDGPLLQEALAPRVVTQLMAIGSEGAGCVVIGKHGCMQVRGIKTTGNVITSCMRGAFLNKAEARAEFLALIKRR